MLHIVYGGGGAPPNPVFHKPLDRIMEVIELVTDLVQPLRNVGASILLGVVEA